MTTRHIIGQPLKAALFSYLFRENYLGMSLMEMSKSVPLVLRQFDLEWALKHIATTIDQQFYALECFYRRATAEKSMACLHFPSIQGCRKVRQSPSLDLG